MTVGGHEDHYALRARMRAALRADLLGPREGADEVLTHDAPVTAYLAGALFPAMAGAAAVDEGCADQVPDVVKGDDEEGGRPDLGVAQANLRRPSSMGLTFSVDTATAAMVTVAVRAARYSPEDEHGMPLTPQRSQARSTGQQRERWRRRQVDCDPVTVPLNPPGMRAADRLADGLELRTLVRPADDRGVVTMTVTIVNTTPPVSESDLQDSACYFQPEIVVSGPDGTAPFVERPAGVRSIDPEQALSRLLHRHAPSFAVGHGCSVAWDWQPPEVGAPMWDRAAVSSVRTELVPTHEVLLMESNPGVDDRGLGMERLGEAKRAEMVRVLDALLDGYETWIAERRADAVELEGSDFNEVADLQVKACSEALERMRDGVRLLGDEERPKVLLAFQLANRAMAAQRAQSQWIKSGRVGRPDARAGRWRPFQIAFMLLCLRGIVEPAHEDRRVADLLWFPTGGGKTEAYLGLVAFTTFLRRLRSEDGGGVTVLMRYTLRLLTLQQFERASALICAMERLRAERADLGDEQISIGMWVGQSATPNKLSPAGARLDELRNSPGKSLQKQNPVQLKRCPWCGTALDARDYEVRSAQHRMLIVCPDSECAFHTGNGLPVHLVDEAVYDAHPTLVIATVDKFASMPWRPATGALFNLDRADTPAPELIVQDELHLISGPLGTMTGLYETAIDVLADKPKVIASTATIRRASEQVGGLFNRDVAQFPPAGLDARDSWFAVETPREAKASRRYMGLFTPGGSQATLLIRTYAALLHAAQAARAEVDADVLDAYWTLVGYFNSLRLLSAAELQLHDDVQSRIKLLAEQDGTVVRDATNQTELSSRADSSDVPLRLGQLDATLAEGNPLDVLLATNMISVGVDIDRLGLMAVMGQPQATAEYIQATSRVGRQHPGLVAVMFNSARSRDRSHYENFQSFHSALYREVESSSVTPFSAGARDRGLHAIIVALARLLIPEAADNDAAAHIARFEQEVRERVLPAVIERVSSVDGQERQATEAHCEEFLEWWRDTAMVNPELSYEGRPDGRSTSLLVPFHDESPEASGWETLWSLRDVDAESGLYFKPNPTGAMR
ncbi:helicase-related protein [Tomitella fengzijianii]|uniref:DNA helicase n=1 Tax=Tomitella fengzijianii TaxID=2597660 RepID=A0A516WZW2_9ACTN|nr:helicase-related protein [Tomitella fengzijianii]QDQ96352.1 DNA helicase [Tomitella fengzijianii]